MGVTRERKLEILSMACEDAAACVPPVFPHCTLEERATYLVFYDIARAAWGHARRSGHAFRPLARAYTVQAG